ncbi:MAG: 2-C-methyl-D-erythritol 4-phosphate cytidylyltransferase [Ekhidna sp.]|nr:2-C-methyl-D-erythritol 4-phosphate cytidylyltransferase [Ekhidna sp.]
MKKYAIIVAGGVGTRMRSATPKQFLLIEEVPIIVHSIRKFLIADPSVEAIVVLPQAHLGEWEKIRTQYFSGIGIKTTVGGSTRSESVQAGLALVQDESLVAIHDAVRPYVSKETINMAYHSAEQYGSGVAVVNLKDSIRELRLDGASEARDRSNYVLVQTPQTFNSVKLKDSYDKVGDGVFTDDASVYEAAGYSVRLVDGSYDNIKITTPEDLK